MAQFEDLIDRMYGGVNPYSGFPRGLFAEDVQGWRSEHPYLDDVLSSVKPTVVVEVGVWKGASSIYIAKKMREVNLDSVLISVDTWLGSSEHLLNPSFRTDLLQPFGMRPIYAKFLNNVVEANLERTIIPLSLDSLNAAEVIKRLGVRPQVIHIDAGHDYASVFGDLSAWWPLLSPGGILVGDDYDPVGNSFPEVNKAFDDFFRSQGLFPIDYFGGKCQILKPDRHDFAFHLDIEVPEDSVDAAPMISKCSLDKRVALACIVKNEAHNIARMLKSAMPIATFCSIIDTGSTDNTAEVADMTLNEGGIDHRIEKIKFIDFSHARNAAIDLIPGDIDWILFLDADEFLVERDYPKFNKLLNSDVDAWRLPRYNFHDLTKQIRPNPYPDSQGRLFVNYGDKRIRYRGRVHEILSGWSKIRRAPVNSIVLNDDEGGPHIHHMGGLTRSQITRAERNQLYQALAKGPLYPNG
ncbi:MAG TPA: class I SAM-dependent methyltransferase [Roseiarcus sp.]